METIFINPENSKTNEPDTNLFLTSQKDQTYENQINMLLFKEFFIYCTWKNIRKQYKNNKLKLIAPTWNDKFELPDGSYSVSVIQDYIKYIIKKHETLTTVPPIHVYTNIIINRLVFKLKDRYRIQLQTPETMKPFGNTKN